MRPRVNLLEDLLVVAQGYRPPQYAYRYAAALGLTPLAAVKSTHLGRVGRLTLGLRSRPHDLAKSCDEHVRIGHERSARDGAVLVSVNLRELGARVRLIADDGDDLGLAHAPAPVELGDVVVSGDGRVWVVTDLIDFGEPRDALDALLEVEPDDC